MTMLRSCSASLTISLALGFGSLFAAPTAAQCAPQWMAAFEAPGVSGTVFAAASWDPDGYGPIPPTVVLGGSLTAGGGVPAGNIVSFESNVWAPLGSGMNGSVLALASLTNGNFVAGGDFTIAGGVAADRVARWVGGIWLPLGSGMDGAVRALITLANGDIVAGGDFVTAGGVVANRVARWNGSAWTPLGSGMDGTVHALVAMSNGDIVAAGDFAIAGGFTASRIARWNGSVWAPLAGGLNGTVRALAESTTGQVVAGGDFTAAGAVVANRVASWNGFSWSPYGSGLGDLSPGTVRALAVTDSGDIVAAGDFTNAGSVPRNRIARWVSVNSTWTDLAGGVDSGTVHVVTRLANGRLVAGGVFARCGGLTANGVAIWYGSSWGGMQAGLNDSVLCVAMRPDGGFVAGGLFRTASGVSLNCIAHWNGSAWLPLGGGVSLSGLTNPVVSAVAYLPNGDLVAGGRFAMAGNVAALNIARWNGTTWFPLGSGVTDTLGATVSAIAVRSNGELIAGGNFTSAGGVAANRIARWNGSTWAPLGSGIGSGGTVRVIKEMPNGDLVVGGNFTSAGGIPAAGIARWNGASWSPLTTGAQDVWAVELLPNGDIVVGGSFSTAGGLTANRIARWNGTSWSALGSGFNNTVRAIRALPNGDLVAAGSFESMPGLAVAGIARWRGSSWSVLGRGLFGEGRALGLFPNGDLLVGGGLSGAGDIASRGVARLTTTCPPSVQTYGVGCTGPGGALSLTADTLPWASSPFRLGAAGVGASSLALLMVSIGQAVPGLPLFQAPVPGPGAGCTLGVASLDLLQISAQLSGSARTFQLPMAIQPTAPGVKLYMQVAELDFSSGWVGTWTTNALACTIGTY
ncbi:MAG: WD40 repeat domain-containing protein [Planctomycetes bacterium]|jgi:hypothetical protein|nr:WD40 repeat domain-containing protein [Planctomycetota bacterium]